MFLVPRFPLPHQPPCAGFAQCVGLTSASLNTYFKIVIQKKSYVNIRLTVAWFPADLSLVDGCEFWVGLSRH